jgi:D-glycero-alpha-D-manno-heptose-7-phosphate kinase
MKYVARAPVRVDPAGGGTDAPPYCLDHGGAVVNFSVARHAYASFERLPKGSGVILHSHDQKKGAHAASVNELKIDGQLDLLKVFTRRLLRNDDSCLLVTQSDVPQGTGLGGSGALGVAILGTITRALGKKLSRSEIALLANDIERTDLGNVGGNQDSYAAALGGIKLITYRKGGGSSCEPIQISEKTRGQLERDTLLIYTGDAHLSGSIHADIRQSYALPDSPTVRAMDNLKAAALKMAPALKAGDIEAYVEALNSARLNHYALHPSCDSDTLRKFFKELSPCIRGGKACGAGGGGFIMVHVVADARKECVRIAEALGGLVWTFQLDDRGLMNWEEPPSSPGQIEAIRKGIAEAQVA